MRLGGMAIASNRFELYLDFGIRSCRGNDLAVAGQFSAMYFHGERVVNATWLRKEVAATEGRRVQDAGVVHVYSPKYLNKSISFDMRKRNKLPPFFRRRVL